MSIYKKSRELVAEPVEDSSLRCRAEHCPNRWSIDAEDGRVCRWHYREPMHLWPRISEEQREAETQRAYERGQRWPLEPTPLTKQQKLDVIAKMRTLTAQRGQADQKAWIAKLQARQAAGERLGMAQRECLAVALRADIVLALDEVSADEQRRREDERRDQAERVAQYAAARGIELPSHGAALNEGTAR